MVVDTTATKITADELPRMPLGDFLRPAEVEDGAEMVIDSPAYVISSRFGKHRAVTVVYKNQKRLLRLNSISLKNLVDAFGYNSEDWVGKKVVAAKRRILDKETVVLSPP